MAEVTSRDYHDAAAAVATAAATAHEDMLLVCGRGLIKETYLKQGSQGVISRRSALKTLLATRSIPLVGLDDMTIEMILSELAAMDSNNFLGNCGLGEREGRVFSQLVAKRHFHLSHGIGRSGDLQEEQPKAAGSSIIYKLTGYLALQALHKMSLTSMNKCLVVPVATGMTLALCMMTLRTQRPLARYVIWSRIDQKSCFKSILTAGFVPLVVDTVRIGDSLHTDCSRIEELIVEYGSENILCIFTTTSCFAPRAPDAVDRIAQICKKETIPHLINNAYGLQCKRISKLINRAVTIGRVDYVVSSTDKNFMVPVGGGIIASPEKACIQAVGRMYPGRASATPIVDLFITLLSMGQNGLIHLLSERERLVKKLRASLHEVSELMGERLLLCESNTISFAVGLEKMNALGSRTCTFFGSMLFQRGVSGTRIVTSTGVNSIEGFEFACWGSSSSSYGMPYFTAACSVGLSEDEIDLFISRLRKTFKIFQKKKFNDVQQQKIQAAESTTREETEEKPSG